MEAIFTPANEQAWQETFDKLELTRPAVGKMVRVVKGKHAGEEGEVFWHGKDKFDKSFSSMNAAQMAVLQAMGRLGYRVGIRTESEKFFVAAENVEVI